MTLRPRFDPYRAAMVPSVIPLAKAAEPAEMPPVVYTLLGVPYTVVPDRRYGFLFKAARRKPAPGQMSFFDAPKAPKAPGTGGRKKMQEGATRMKNGQQQVLKNSRWRNVEPKGKAIPKPGLSIIPDGTPSKVKPKTRKGKEWQSSSPAKAPAAVGGEAMGATSLRPKAKPPLPMPSVLGDEDIFEDNAPATSSTLKPKGESKKSTSPQYKLGPSETTPYLVDVSGITSTVPRSAFDADQVESLAQSILESGGLLSPIVLKQTGPESFEVLAGDLEYHAAARAKELDPRKGEMVNAYVVPPQNQAAAVEQVNRAKPTVRPKKGDSTSPQYKLGPSETKHYLVDVSGITSTVPRSAFGADQVESLAQSILESGGLLSPIVLKQTGPESYEVLAGDLEYHAAARAKELDPRKGEMVNAYVVPPQHQAAAVAQVTPATPVAAEVVGAGGDVDRAGMGYKIRSAGAEFELLKEHSDGSYTVKNDQGMVWRDTFDPSVTSVVPPANKKTGGSSLDAIRAMPESDYVKMTVGEKQSNASKRLQSAENAIREHLQDKKIRLPVGIHPGQWIESKTRLTKNEKELRTEYLLAKKNDAYFHNPKSMDYERRAAMAAHRVMTGKIQSSEASIVIHDDPNYGLSLEDKLTATPVAAEVVADDEPTTLRPKVRSRAERSQSFDRVKKTMQEAARGAIRAGAEVADFYEGTVAAVADGLGVGEDVGEVGGNRARTEAMLAERDPLQAEPTTLRPKRTRAERKQDFDQIKQNLYGAGVSTVRAAQSVQQMGDTAAGAVADAYGLDLDDDAGLGGTNTPQLEPTLGDMLSEQKAIAGESPTIHAERMSKLSRLANSADELPPGVTRKTAKEGFRKMQEALNSGDTTVPKLLKDWERQNITPEQALWRVHSYGQGQDPYQPMPVSENTEPTSDWESKLNELKQVGSEMSSPPKKDDEAKTGPSPIPYDRHLLRNRISQGYMESRAFYARAVNTLDNALMNGKEVKLYPDDVSSYGAKLVMEVDGKREPLTKSKLKKKDLAFFLSANVLSTLDL